MAIELHQFAVDWDLPNPSPFCMKMETWLRMAELPYTVHAWSPGRAPHGKAPVVVVDGELIADTTQIIRELTRRFDVALDAGLTPLERAQGLLVQRTLEEHTYFVVLIDRWLTDEVWTEYRQVIGQPAPALLRRPATAFLRRGVRQSVHGQGLGRLPQAEVHRRAIDDVDAVLAVLGDKPFLFGEEPVTADATVFAWFVQLLHPISRGTFADHCRSQPALVAYVQRMKERVWPELVAA